MRRPNGWQRQHAQQPMRRSSTSLIGEHATTIMPPKAEPPKESWWAKPVQSRDEFDRLAAERAKAAKWVGANTKDAEDTK